MQAKARLGLEGTLHEGNLGRIAEVPERTAILLDVDGVLAPIVDVPQDSAVPEETRVELRRLNRRPQLLNPLRRRSNLLQLTVLIPARPLPPERTMRRQPSL